MAARESSAKRPSTWPIGGSPECGCGQRKLSPSRKGGLPHEVDVPKTPPDHVAHPPGGGVVWPGEADARSRWAVSTRGRQPA